MCKALDLNSALPEKEEKHSSVIKKRVFIHPVLTRLPGIAFCPVQPNLSLFPWPFWRIALTLVCNKWSKYCVSGLPPFPWFNRLDASSCQLSNSPMERRQRWRREVMRWQNQVLQLVTARATEAAGHAHKIQVVSHPLFLRGWDWLLWWTLGLITKRGVVQYLSSRVQLCFHSTKASSAFCMSAVSQGQGMPAILDNMGLPFRRRRNTTPLPRTPFPLLENLCSLSVPGMFRTGWFFKICFTSLLEILKSSV